MNGRIRTELKGYDALAELALDLRWSWNHYADTLWKELDASLWELTRNPWTVLQTVSRDKLASLLSDQNFRKIVDDFLLIKRNQTSSSTWFQDKHSDTSLSCIAYFSMEFMLSEALPIYSGGLGNVAGDQLKSASDLGVPVVGVGLLYQQGYFRQIIDKDGAQQAVYPYNDPGQLPIKPLRKPNGEWLRLEVKLPGWPIWVRVWEVQVGRIKLYLLDSNDAANYPVHRGITSELYGGGSELRLKQELLLGICGWRIFEALGVKPDVCHLNEGHAAFAILERAKSFMNETEEKFEVALAATRAGNLFTTHTAVSAGFDRFTPALIEQYLGNYAKEQLKISLNELLALGRQDPNNSAELFNMAYLAIHGSGAVNGVSRLHGEVSRKIFSPLFPYWPEDEVPVSYVTNGVHMPSWDSEVADDLWTEACGKNRWLGGVDDLEKGIRCISDTKLWHMRNAARKKLIEYARSRLSRQLAASGASVEDVEQAKHLFDPDALTLGFARRFATYKRPNMLLHNPERLLRILSNSQRPVQLLIAGKAHPADLPGQALIQQWIKFIRGSGARNRVIFISDYDMLLTEQMVSGVDVWINTPRRPWEACGTSGMKVLVNGGLNLSELDGWWAEAYTPEVGWALGDGKEHDSDLSWDAAEASALYDLLESQVIPEFYTRDSTSLPIAWLARIRESMASLTPRFSANRAVREYTELHYLPAAKAYQKRCVDKAMITKNLIDWQHRLQQKWNLLRFDAVKFDTKQDQHHFEARVYLDDLDPKDIIVELFANAIQDIPKVIQQMKHVGQIDNEAKIHLYQGTVPSSRPAFHYTPRIIPFFAGASVPLESNQILWQKK